MARFTLNAAKGGINRERTEGSPSPQVLYDLVNGYVNSAGKIVSRYGTRVTHRLPAGVTKGFVVFQGGFVVFSHEPQTVPSGVTCEVLVHPEDPSLQIAKIHFASPFLSFLYVVAEFTDGAIYHYWLQRATPWQANTIYLLGQLVEPTTPNGYVYRAERLGDPNPLWSAGALRSAGDKIEPTVPNGYYFEVTGTAGTTPRSGTVEPAWKAQEGAVTFEYADATPPTTPGTGPTTPPADPTGQTGGRYGNPSGTGGDFRSEQ